MRDIASWVIGTIMVLVLVSPAIALLMGNGSGRTDEPATPAPWIAPTGTAAVPLDAGGPGAGSGGDGDDEDDREDRGERKGKGGKS